MQRYRVTKILVSSEPVAATAETIEQYRENLSSKYGFSPPIDYYVEGTLLQDPKVNDTLWMKRDNRNGVMIAGIFTTSVIKSIEVFEDYSIITTRNSIYKLEPIYN